MRLAFVALTLLMALSGCQTIQSVFDFGPPGPALFVVFFAPGSVELSPEAREIVEQAAADTRGTKYAMIEIALPPDAPGGAAVRERRFTAIQNALSAAMGDPRLNARAALSAATANIPGAADRAEIRLTP